MKNLDREISEASSKLAESSPPWGRTTKIVIIITSLLIIGLAAQRFKGLIAMIVLAGVIAYILNPLIKFINERTRLSRGWVILIVYLLLAGGVGWLFIALGVAAYDQATEFIILVPNLIDQIAALIETAGQSAQSFIIFDRFIIDPVRLPWDSINNQILSLVEPTLSTSTQVATQLAATTVRTVGNFIFVIVISVYLAIEFPHLGKYINRIASQPGYEADAKIISNVTGQIWSAFLRGQVILGVIIFFVVWLGLAILGVQNALALGLLAGVLEFIPTIGPIVSTFVAMVVAFFQPVTPWGLQNWQFALIVLGLMLLIQQIENNVLVPRIVGRALDLHPLAVIIGVLMGASIAGILGAVLAAPVLATLKLLSNYIWRKLFDLPPFPSLEDSSLGETSSDPPTVDEEIKPPPDPAIPPSNN